MFGKKVMQIIGNVRVGKAQARHDTPTHVKGVREGNSRGHTKHEKGVHAKKESAWATASRSTGINPLARNSIVPGAPRLTPP